MRPLLKPVAELYENKNHGASCHPGLWLDKAATPGKQEETRGDLEHFIKLANNSNQREFDEIRKEHIQWLGDTPSLTLRTIGPLAIHLARASALENAGICLHPVHGFAYIPGSGLKGLARAFATLHSGASSADIEAVFGGIDSAGAIIFHDAWPAARPKLILDIVNCHHSEYYGAGAEKEVPPPGDWESPVPVCFPAVGAGTPFTFHLDVRKAFRAEYPADAQRLLGLAKQWLASGLHHLGAGAKTNAGYGRFEKCEEVTVLPLSASKTFECTLELATPAFLAGAKQEQEDCDLRPATLRGLLRWWWRSLYRDRLSNGKLHEMENALWGSAAQGGLIAIAVEAVTGNPGAIPAPFKKEGDSSNGSLRLVFDPQFLKDQKLVKAENKKTQGLAYLAYGMDEIAEGKDKKKARKRRHCAQPGSRWNLRIACREGADPDIAKEKVRDHAVAALWLLTNYGGVGSKARKGFGSLQTSGLDGWGWGKIAKLQPAPNAQPALLAEVTTNWENYWFVLDQIGASYSDFLQAGTETGHGKHCEGKIAFGLPRKLHGPLKAPLPHQSTWREPINLGEKHPYAKKVKKLSDLRDPAPFHLHVERKQDGTYLVRVIAFPSKVLPNQTESERLLKQLVDHFRHDIAGRSKRYASMGSASSVSPPPVQRAATIPATGTRVQAVLLEEKTKKGGWKAALASDPSKVGPIQNTTDVPADKQPKEQVELIVANSEPAFRWPTERDNQPNPPASQKPSKRHQGNRGR